MILAELFPKGYLVAQAWRKWFDTDKPPFMSIDELGKWADRWLLLVQDSWPNVQRAYRSFETAGLGFRDDPRFNPMPSRSLWGNADNRVLRQIMADRAEIAKALGTDE